MALLLTTIVFRFATLLNQGLAADESTYLIIGRAMFNGYVYLVDLWDFKPIGIFVLFGLVQHYLHDSVLAVRILGLISIYLSSLLVYKVKLVWGDDKIKALFSGFIYLLLLSFVNPVYDVNTEVFFNFFTLLGLLILIKYPRPFFILLSGLSLGIGFMLKYVVLFDTVVIYLFFILGWYGSGKLKFNSKNILKSLWAVLGFCLPFASTILFYYIIGEFDVYYSSTFETTKVYSERMSFWREVKYFLDFNLLLLPVIAVFYFAIYALLVKNKGQRNWGVFALTWFAVAWIPVVLQGKHFVHYFIQLFVPIALFVSHGTYVFKVKGLTSLFIGLLVVFLGYSFHKQLKEIQDNGSNEKEAVAYLKPMLDEEDVVYCNFQSYYYLLDKMPPSRIIHQSLLVNRSHKKASVLDINFELEHIINTEPDYLIIDSKTKYPMEIMEQLHHYNVLKIIDKDIKIYARKL